MRRRRALSAFSLGLTCAVSACSGGGAPQFTVEHDTLEMFGHGSVAPTARLVHPNGRIDTVLHPALQVPEGSVVRLHEYGLISCAARGEARLTLSHRSHTTQQVVRCHLATRLAGPNFSDLTLGQTPLAFELYAVDSAGGRQRIRQFVPRMSDSSVVAVRGDSIHPLAVGRTTISFLVGGAAIPTSVTVREIIAHDSLRLAPGEFRSWPLAAGRYEITMQRASSADDFKAIDMQTEGAKCVRDSRSEETIHCLVRERGGIAVRNISAGAVGRVQRAVLWIVRAP